MAAFTTFSSESLSRYLIMYELGELVKFTPITQGIENSNYFIEIADQTVSTEYRFLDANNPSGNWKVIQPRERNLEYSVDHFEGNF